MSCSMQSIQNLGLGVIAIAAGLILDSDGYFILGLFFCTCVISKLLKFKYILIFH